MMKAELRYYLVLWLAAVILASLVGRLLYGNGSTDFWIAATSLPTSGGGSVSVSSWSIIPVSDVWYYLILSIAGGITVAGTFTTIVRAAIAHNWKRASVWLGGLLCVTLSAYVISLLAYSAGAWQKLGLIVFYNSRGPLGPTLIFAIAIIVAKLLSNGARSGTGKRALFLALSGLPISGILIGFAIPVLLRPTPGPDNAVIALIILDGLVWVASAVMVAFALVKLAARRVQATGARPEYRDLLP